MFEVVFHVLGKVGMLVDAFDANFREEILKYNSMANGANFGLKIHHFPLTHAAAVILVVRVCRFCLCYVEKILKCTLLE